MSEFSQEELELLVDLHVRNERQGPGSIETIEKALSFLNLPSDRQLKIADVGCGTGFSSLALSLRLNCSITSVDFLQPFLDKLDEKASESGVDDKITTCNESMDALSFQRESLDIIWSEGAVYNMGFKAGIEYWRQFLSPKGYLVVSEITWTKSPQPAELSAFWKEAYPEIDTAGNKIAQLEDAGYDLVAYFVLPENCWTYNYYCPLMDSYDDFLTRHSNSELAKRLIEADKEEQLLYQKYKDYYSYGMYIAQKR